MWHKIVLKGFGAFERFVIKRESQALSRVLISETCIEK